MYVLPLFIMVKLYSEDIMTGLKQTLESQKGLSNDAKPKKEKKPATEKQLAALKKAREARALKKKADATPNDEDSKKDDPSKNVDESDDDDDEDVVGESSSTVAVTTKPPPPKPVKKRSRDEPPPWFTKYVELKKIRKEYEKKAVAEKKLERSPVKDILPEEPANIVPKPADEPAPIPHTYNTPAKTVPSLHSMVHSIPSNNSGPYSRTPYFNPLFPGRF